MYSIRRLIRIIIQVYRRKEMFHKDKNQSARELTDDSHDFLDYV